MKLIWCDEFDGPTLDLANWTHDLGGGGWGNAEAEIYTSAPANVRVENSLLIIEAHKAIRVNGEVQFTSARLKTQGLRAFQYGRIEARAKVPAGAGLWPAFWLLGENFPQMGWPACGEIAIMEYFGKTPHKILGALHGPGYSGPLGRTGERHYPTPLADDFHTYAIEWDADQISWLADGEPYHSVTRQAIAPHRWVFDQPFFILLNLAVGGTLGGAISPATVFPAQYLVDYVRVFQK